MYDRADETEEEDEEAQYTVAEPRWSLQTIIGYRCYRVIDRDKNRKKKQTSDTRGIDNKMWREVTCTTTKCEVM